VIGHVAPTALASLVDRFPRRRVLVVGDVMLDHFLYGRVNRISPEAPVPVVEFDHEEFRLGGAANVAHNLQAFGAAAVLVGVVGDDDARRRVVGGLADLGLQSDGLVCAPDRPTTRKMRVVTTRNQQVARVDYEGDRDVTGGAEAAVVARAVSALPSAEAVVVSDYLKGVVTATVMGELVREAAARNIPVLVDPKIPHIDHYRGAALVTPNHYEAEVATATRIRSDADARAAARAFRARAGCASVLITRGEHGMWLLDGTAGDGGRATELSLPASAREVADVTGAGDTVIATMALALAAGASLLEAATLANHAAGISVSKFGPATVTRDELLQTFG
jgi:D-beta-D-heptose 7-phosphate kinase/D-beta-D-heptose 1-phosphate adenosyltransferase